MGPSRWWNCHWKSFLVTLSCWVYGIITTSKGVLISIVIQSLMADMLNRWTLQAGEVSTSARAITHQDLKALHSFNESYRKEHPVSAVPRRNDPTAWGNGNTRCMLHLLYLVSFWCLLRYDEALNIQWSDLTFVDRAGSESGQAYIVVDVEFRKTHQLGGKSFPFGLDRSFYWFWLNLNTHHLRLRPVLCIRRYQQSTPLSSPCVYRLPNCAI